VLVLDGSPRRWRRPGLEVIPQRGVGLGERLAAAFEDVAEPALLVGMDTPQLTPKLLSDGLEALSRPGVDAVLGPALDGGYWSVGVKGSARDPFAGVPMSTRTTLARQRSRLLRLGMTIHEQPTLRDVDTIVDARAVARDAPGTRFASTLAGLA
jgi:uncharacterized protein